MTLVHFNYTDSYNKPSRGSLAFTPHRRHAANETEILPKPVTVPLLNGELTVDLQPNPSTWVWIITEYFDQHSESMYTTIPDSDGVIEAVDLIKINPSTIPAPYNAVEPVWWAEMRQYKQTVTNTLLQSEEALTEAKEAIEVGSESIEQTQHNASLAKAYAEQSREDSYASRDYRDEAKTWRDEAQEQADRAATGPESAATRAENAAERAETSETRSRDYEDDARSHAAESRDNATITQNASQTAVTSSTEAKSEADRATTEAGRAQGYADDLLAGPTGDADRAEQARDEAQGYATTTKGYVTDALNHANDAETYRDAALNATSLAEQHRDNTQQLYNDFTDHHAFTEWQPLKLNGSWEAYTTGFTPPQYAYNDRTVELTGFIHGGSVGSIMFNIPELAGKSKQLFTMVNNDGTMARITVHANGNATLESSASPDISYVMLDGLSIPRNSQV